ELVKLHWKQVAFGGAVAGILMSVPVWRVSVDERFVLEPAQRAVLRSPVAGRVQSVTAEEGSRVTAGAPIAQLSNLDVESSAAQATADYRQATAHTVQAQLRQASFAAAENERVSLAEKNRLESDRVRQLQIVSPISGTVITPHVRDLVGSYLIEGSEVAEVADTSTMRANVYVQEDELQKIEKISKAVLRMDANWRPSRATFESFSP